MSYAGVGSPSPDWEKGRLPRMHCGLAGGEMAPTTTCQRALLQGELCPMAEGFRQHSQPLSPCSPGRNLSRGSAARWRGASPGQAGERSAGLLLP